MIGRASDVIKRIAKKAGISWLNFLEQPLALKIIHSRYWQVPGIVCHLSSMESFSKRLCCLCLCVTNSVPYNVMVWFFKLQLIWQLELNTNDFYMFLKKSSYLRTCTIYFWFLDYTTLFAQNNISLTTDQKSLGQPFCLTADAATSLLSVEMNNLGIANASPLQPQASHSENVTELQKVDDGQNSHGDSHDRPAPTSPQSNFMFGSIDHPKQTTDVSRQGTEEIVYTNHTDLTDKQLEPEHVRASASNHEVKDEYSIWCIKAILCCLRVRNAILYESNKRI